MLSYPNALDFDYISVPIFPLLQFFPCVKFFTSDSTIKPNFYVFSKTQGILSHKIIIFG